MGIIYDLAKNFIGKKIEDKTSMYDKDIKKLFAETNSITKMAKKSLMTYPAIFSENIIASNEDLMFAICNFLEIRYAVFTMIAIGMDPVFAGTDPSKHIMKFYSEESDNLIEKDNIKYNAKINISTESFKIPLDHLKEYNYSIEAANRRGKNNTSSSNVKLTKIEQKAKSSDPTVIQVKLKMGQGQHEVEFPLSIKVIPRFITDEESSQIFSYLKEDKPITTFVKLLSGEISLFKDIIFQINRAKSDKKLYSRLGRHPWFRQLLERKNSRRISNFLNFLNHKPSDVLPMCALVVTKDEIEKGYGNLWSKIKKNEESSIINKLMLLCLCVVDTTTSIVEFSFHSFKDNDIYKIDTLLKEFSNKGKDKDLESLMKTLIYKSI